MEYIGKRISVLKKEGEISIVILSTADKKKKLMLMIWFLLWTISGIIIFVQFFLIKEEQTRIALLVWLGFWSYFEYMTFKAVMWRNSGVEKIKLRENKLFYKRDISGRGKIHVYELDFIKDLRLSEPKKNSFVEDLNNSYWVIAGEKILFDYYGKEVKIGIQLDEAESKSLFKILEREIRSME
ncbi:MAG: hypothetical protein M3R27_04285 [Bacteroidota bacterium]|nr:hypothetical protein [Bacteroidota bacterium]